MKQKMVWRYDGVIMTRTMSRGGIKSNYAIREIEKVIKNTV